MHFHYAIGWSFRDTIQVNIYLLSHRSVQLMKITTLWLAGTQRKLT